VTVPRTYPWAPPRASVVHDRWIGFPHVLQGERLCLFLHLDAEWDPTAGRALFLISRAGAQGLRGPRQTRNR
jgi:hypothetical protein